MFTVLDHANSAHVTLIDPRVGSACIRQVVTLAEPSAIAYAVLAFARERGMSPMQVETSIRYPDVAFAREPRAGCRDGPQQHGFVSPELERLKRYIGSL